MTALASVYRICSYSYSVRVHTAYWLWRHSSVFLMHAWAHVIPPMYRPGVCKLTVDYMAQLYGRDQHSVVAAYHVHAHWMLVIMAHVSRVVAALWPVFSLGLLGVVHITWFVWCTTPSGPENLFAPLGLNSNDDIHSTTRLISTWHPNCAFTRTT